LLVKPGDTLLYRQRRLQFFSQYQRSSAMENIIGLIIQLVSGAAGGNIAGALFKNISLGTLWNSVAGIVGGGLGGQILQAVLGTGAATAAATGAGLDVGAIISQVAGGGVGGAILMAIVGLIRSMMSKA
jgi:hypothetical protein